MLHRFYVEWTMLTLFSSVCISIWSSQQCWGYYWFLQIKFQTRRQPRGGCKNRKKKNKSRDFEQTERKTKQKSISQTINYVNTDAISAKKIIIITYFFPPISKLILLRNVRKRHSKPSTRRYIMSQGITASLKANFHVAPTFFLHHNLFCDYFHALLTLPSRFHLMLLNLQHERIHLRQEPEKTLLA